MIRCFDILIGCNSALIQIRLHPDPDPVKIRIRPDPWDPVQPWSKASTKLQVTALKRCLPVNTGQCEHDHTQTPMNTLLVGDKADNPFWIHMSSGRDV